MSITKPSTCPGVDYGLLLSYCEAESTQNSQRRDDFYTNVVQLCMSHIAGLAGGKLNVEIVPSGTSESAMAWAESPDSVFLGLDLVRRLGEASLAFSGYLLQNFMFQHMGFGPAVPLPLLVRAENFPEAALQLYVPNMLPGATSPLGTLRNDYDSVVASMRFSGEVSLSDIIGLQGKMPKSAAAKDWHASIEGARSLLSGEPMPHLVLLFGRIFTNSVTLVLAHEASHLLLGHLDEATPTPARSREEEVAADGNALSLLSKSADFNLRSAILLFGFLSESDKVAALDTLSHPFAADRLGVLAASVMATKDVKLETDLNAGFDLIRRPLPLEVEEHLLPPGVTLQAYVSANLYYIVTVTLEITVQGEEKQSQGENLWEKWELACDLTIRDRVHPGAIVLRGNVVSLLSSTQSNLFRDCVTYFCTAVMDAPPSWWVSIPGGVLGIERAALRSAKVPAAAKDVPEQPWSSPMRLSDDLLLQHFRTDLAASRDWAVLAARRSITREDIAVAIAMVLDVKAELLGPNLDMLLWLSAQLIDRGEYARAAQLLDDALRSGPFVPLGFRGTLAQAKWKLYQDGITHLAANAELGTETTDLYDSSIDLAFREMNSSFDTPEQKSALALIGEIISSGATTQVATAMLQASQLSNSGYKLIQQDPQKARQYFTAAAQVLADAEAESEVPLVFTKQLAGEALFAEAAFGDRNFTQAIALFKQVIAADPSFVPALTELAKVQMEERDLGSVRATLKQADRIAPNHKFLNYVRDEFRRRLQKQTAPMIQSCSDAVSSGDYQTALKLAETLLQLDPDCQEAMYLHSIANYLLGNVEPARKDMEQYLEAAGERFDAAVLMGQMLIELGQHHQAADMLGKLIGAAQHSPSEEYQVDGHSFIPYSGAKGMAFARAVRAVADFHTGSTQRALAAAQQSALDFPTGGISLLDCAEVFRLAGKIAEAEQYAKSALQADNLSLSQRQAAQAHSFIAGADISLLAPAGG